MPSKKPPQSIRLGAAREARVDEYAERRSLSRSGAIQELIDLGLGVAEGKADRAVEQAAKPLKPKATPAAPPKVSLQVGPVAVAPGSRLKKR